VPSTLAHAVTPRLAEKSFKKKRFQNQDLYQEPDSAYSETREWIFGCFRRTFAALCSTVSSNRTGLHASNQIEIKWEAINLLDLDLKIRSFQHSSLAISWASHWTSVW